MAEFHEYDVVRVTQLLQPDRHFTGYESIKRPPQVGDVGTIVDIHPEMGSWCIVECVAGDGSTIWLADFMTNELELVEAAK
jgi:hypothetical protein